MTIGMFGTGWCTDCKRAKHFLGEQRVHYGFVDVDADPAGRAMLQQINDRKDIIPTLVFDDGSVLVEPSNAERSAKLGLQQTRPARWRALCWSRSPRGSHARAGHGHRSKAIQ